MKLLAVFTAVSMFLVCKCVNSPVCSVDPHWRIDCYPETIPSAEKECEARGCCFQPNLKINDDEPWCYYPSDYPTYQVTQISNTSYGYSALLSLKASQKHAFGPGIAELSLDIYLETKERLHFKIRDFKNQRYEVPISTPITNQATMDPTLYNVDIKSDRFGIVITRKSTGTVIFDTTIGPLIYANQFIQISSKIPSTYLYGLGERHENTLIDTNWKRKIFWARDQRPIPNANLYGDHPFYLVIEDGSNSHGVFLLNSNAKEVATQPAPSVTWRTIGGILDFYVFLGPSPESVVQQYTAVIGKPFLPPFWSLGFHLCRWGYNSSDNTLNMVKRMRNAFIPQDVQWNDIDYMKSRLDFTHDPSKFNTLPQVVDTIHSYNQHYVMIIDPGISDKQAHGSYSPYDDGIANDIFIKDSTGSKPVEGLVWPGKTVFPDFTHPRAEQYWEKQLRSYHSVVPFDGVWVDMNEPSNFIRGSTAGCPNNSLEKPPYLPRITGTSLSSSTLCVSSLQYNNITHYNLHSLTGLFEMKATSKALTNILGRRPFVISRSTFPGAGMYGGHWNGDIVSTWADLKQSIASVINFNMFGIPMVGSDICGFSGDTTEELCTRWMQLGSFYPFSRNHNYLLSRAQAPVDFSKEAQSNMRQALLLRYSLLPYLYSLFFSSHVNGGTVARGLFFEFPSDKTTLNIDEQFMWGSALLISPVLQKQAVTVNAYFPAGAWYCLTGSVGIAMESEGEWINLQAPLNKIPLHVRGGHIIPIQAPALTATETRLGPVNLIVAPDMLGNGEGFLFWDDGDSLNTYESGMYWLANFTFKDNTLVSTVVHPYLDKKIVLGEINIFNVTSAITSVHLNGNEIPFELHPYNVLHFDASVDLNSPFQVELIFKK